jgi:tetratricopeptide (TPR) repeat protein
VTAVRRPALRSLWATILASLILGGTARAQQESMSRAFELERRGNYAAAAEAYRTILASKPGDLAALLGLERALLPISRTPQILPQVRAALAVSPTNPAIYGVALRAWAAADEPDSMRVVAERWARVAPGDESPYREWGAAALSRQDRGGAREAYTLGRQRLSQPDALAGEMAQLAVADSDFVTALREWLPAVRRLPGYRVTAVATLAQAPDAIRPELLRKLDEEDDLVAKRVKAELQVRWGDPLSGIKTLEPALPGDRTKAIEALRGLLDQLRSQRSREALLAQGRILEAIAARSPDPLGPRFRLEAAHAYSAAGDRDAARRMLAGLADDSSAPGSVSSGAALTLVSVLIDEGKLDEANRRLARIQASVSADEFADLQRRIVLGWVRAGDLARADSALAGDSTVEALALSGKIRLYRGDVRGAIERLKAAGPFAGDRADATHRTMLLALLQPIEADSLPELGTAMLLLEQGDSTRAASALEKVAAGLPPEKGGAELKLLAGRLAAATGKTGDAERLFRAAAIKEAGAAAPAAELALAQLLLDNGRQNEAVAQLEHLILTYPESALVPQARRTLDQARGAVPKT